MLIGVVVSHLFNIYTWESPTNSPGRTQFPTAAVPLPGGHRKYSCSDDFRQLLLFALEQHIVIQSIKVRSGNV